MKGGVRVEKHPLCFAAVGSVLTIAFLITVNLLTSSNVLWFIYPAFVLIMWPLSMILIQRQAYRLHALFGSILVFSFLLAVNYTHSPQHPWILYAAFPFLWWPITVFCGQKAKTLAYACVVSVCTILYYAFLNMMLAPQYPWAIYPAFAILWWPLALYYVRRKDYFGLSVGGSVWTIIFFATVNIISTPQLIWAVYPAFAILWWPLSMYYFYVKKKELQAQRVLNKG
jgi:hypothetical protein